MNKFNKHSGNSKNVTHNERNQRNDYSIKYSNKQFFQDETQFQKKICLEKESTNQKQNHPKISMDQLRQFVSVQSKIQDTQSNITIISNNQLQQQINCKSVQNSQQINFNNIIPDKKADFEQQIKKNEIFQISQDVQSQNMNTIIQQSVEQESINSSDLDQITEECDIIINKNTDQISEENTQSSKRNFSSLECSEMSENIDNLMIIKQKKKLQLKNLDKIKSLYNELKNTVKRIEKTLPQDIVKFVENAQNQKNQKFSLMRRFDKLYNFYTNLENNKQKSFNINQQ